jgi:predicted transcriptional regulator
MMKNVLLITPPESTKTTRSHYMTKKLIEIASEIVQTQVSLTTMSGAEIASSLRQVFSTLQELEKAETGGIELAPTAAEEVAATKLSPANSIQNDKVICLECGAEMRQLTGTHLSSHGISPKQYRKKYGFTMRTPLAAKSLSKARSKAMKKRGLPDKLRQYQEARRKEKAEVPTEAAEIVTTGKQKPMLTPENSIQNDKVICLECGAEFKQLTQTHLSSHGMSPKEYKKKYGFSMRTPLYAKSLTKAAKKRGLPENLRKAIEAKRQSKAEASTQAATETVTASKPKRTRLRKKKA